MPTQCHDASARPADVAEEKLDDGCSANVLDADGVLRLAHRVDPARRALAAAVRGHVLADLVELLAADPAHLLDEFRGVVSVVSLEDLEDRSRMLQRLVPGKVVGVDLGAVPADLLSGGTSLRSEERRVGKGGGLL